MLETKNQILDTLCNQTFIFRSLLLNLVILELLCFKKSALLCTHSCTFFKICTQFSTLLHFSSQKASNPLLKKQPCKKGSYLIDKQKFYGLPAHSSVCRKKGTKKDPVLRYFFSISNMPFLLLKINSQKNNRDQFYIRNLSKVI